VRIAVVTPIIGDWLAAPKRPAEVRGKLVRDLFGRVVRIWGGVVASGDHPRAFWIDFYNGLYESVDGVRVALVLANYETFLKAFLRPRIAPQADAIATVAPK
jgi:hypothetical protein